MKKPRVIGVIMVLGIIAVIFLPVTYGETSEFPDADGDGIPDDVDVDSDGDGLPDLVEFVAGTDPFDDTSVVYIENLAEFVQEILGNTTIETVV
ncbi:MAG: hypothetical protein ACXQTW_08685 [Candidatus Methanospirareceae archaeon]